MKDSKVKVQDFSELRMQLAFYAEDNYREFIMRGIPSERPFLGVRIPQIREIINSVSPNSYDQILAKQPVVFEEVVARGMLICKLPYAEALKYFDSQINIIDDWCSCDTFCAEFSKIIKKQRAEFLDKKIEQLLTDKREFAVRAGLVFLKCAYLDFDYLNLIFDRAERLSTREEYYIKMALSWLIAECFIKFPDETYAYLNVANLPKWTFNKTISKICDSYRVAPEAKGILRKMRK